MQNKIAFTSQIRASVNIRDKLEILSKAPQILIELIDDIPADLLKVRRIPGKWSIHEHACHMHEAQKMMLKRFQTFTTIKNPKFDPYLPGTEATPADHLLELNLKKCLSGFKNDREELINFLSTFMDSDWENAGYHPEY